MTATIVRLADFRPQRPASERTVARSDSGLLCPLTGIVFPPVFRAAVPLRPGARPVVFYALDPATDGRAAPYLFDRIDRPDPALDHGWIVVRHHASREEAEGYLFGWEDFGPHRAPPRRPVGDADGVFTLIHRRHVPQGLPDSLLVLRASRPGELHDRDAVTAIGPDGAPVEDRIAECI